MGLVLISQRSEAATTVEPFEIYNIFAKHRPLRILLKRPGLEAVHGNVLQGNYFTLGMTTEPQAPKWFPALETVLEREEDEAEGSQADKAGNSPGLDGSRYVPVASEHADKEDNEGKKSPDDTVQAGPSWAELLFSSGGKKKQNPKIDATQKTLGQAQADDGGSFRSPGSTCIVLSAASPTPVNGGRRAVPEKGVKVDITQHVGQDQGNNECEDIYYKIECNEAKMGLRYLRSNSGISDDVIHVHPGSWADRNGVKLGDMIIEVNEFPLESLSEEETLDILTGPRPLEICFKRPGCGSLCSSNALSEEALTKSPAWPASESEQEVTVTDPILHADKQDKGEGESPDDIAQCGTTWAKRLFGSSGMKRKQFRRSPEGENSSEFRHVGKGM